MPDSSTSSIGVETFHRRGLHAVLTIVVLFLLPLTGFGADGGPDAGKVDEAIRRGAEYLIRMQRLDGSWSKNYTVGQTALSALALKKAGLPADHPAIEKALNFLCHNPPIRTYDVSVLLVLLEAVGHEGYEEWVERCGDMLLETQTARLWAYPSGAVDMSNTQYAALGLRSAAACGFKTGTEVWKELLRGTVASQTDDGGWGYHRNSKSTGSMTVAGLTCLLVCQEQLTENGRKKRVLPNFKETLTGGLAWMDRHFAVDRNPKPHSNPKHYRWTYYYLYGVERVGTLAGRETFMDRDWYADGARWLLKRQGKNGNWGTAYGESEMNTAFAILFLSRATLGARTSSNLKSRILLQSGGGKTDIVIGCNRQNPGYVWIESWSKKVADKFGIKGGEQAIRVEKVDYFAGGKLLGTVTEDSAGGRITRFPLKYRFEQNGDQEIHAAVTCGSRHGTIRETFETGKVKIYVHNVLTEMDRVQMEDLGANLLHGADPAVEVSSFWGGGWNGQYAVDGFQGRGWLSSKPEVDGAPWIEVELDKPVRANLVKVTHASADAFDPNRFGRAVRVRLTVNRGAQKHVVDVGSDERVKHEIPFRTTRVKRLRIEVLDRVKGTHHTASGFGEIELFYQPPR